MPYHFTFGLSLAACFVLQWFALRGSGGRTTKSESNFFSSVARIQTGVRDSPDFMLLGSSMTGRFPDRTSGFKGVANLGCDGGSALDTLRAIDKGTLPSAPVLIIEGNTFYRSLSGAPSQTADAIDGPWFSVGRAFPLLGATARPSAFVYSKLLARRTGKAGDSDGPSLPHGSVQVVGRTVLLSEQEGALVDEITGILKRLESAGSRVILVILPPGAAADSPNIRLPMAVSGRAGVPLLDLTSEAARKMIRFTDGVHLDAGSASACLRTILRATKDQAFTGP